MLNRAHIPDHEDRLEEADRRVTGRKRLGAVAHQIRFELGAGAFVLGYEHSAHIGMGIL